MRSCMGERLPEGSSSVGESPYICFLSSIQWLQHCSQQKSHNYTLHCGNTDSIPIIMKCGGLHALWIPACYDPQCFCNFFASFRLNHEVCYWCIYDRLSLLLQKKTWEVNISLFYMWHPLAQFHFHIYLRGVVTTSPDGHKAGSAKMWLKTHLKRSSPHLLFLSLCKVGSRTNNDDEFSVFHWSISSFKLS